MRDITLSELQQLQPTITAEDALQMDQDTFRLLYHRTARPLWVYLLRRTGSAELADDLLQETYYRFLRTRVIYESEAHRKNYLFRIASNLANDVHRQKRDHVELSETDPALTATQIDSARQSARRTDL